MALTPSNMLPLQTHLKDFELLNTQNNQWEKMSDYVGEKGTLIVFMCNHCPYVIHLLEHLVTFSNEAKKQGITTIAISSNDVANYPDDGPEKMKILAEQYAFDFPYFYDESQAAAKAYDAACTPDFYLLDHNKALFYRGRYDASRPGNDTPLSGNDLREAIDLLLSGGVYSKMQYPSMGCNIKWKKE